MKWLDFRKPSFRNKLATGLLLVTCCIVIWLQMPPTFSLNLEKRALDRDDAYALDELARDLKQILDWDPEFVSDTAVHDLANWVSFNCTAPRDSVDASELIRRQDNLAHEDFAFKVTNGQLLLLDLSGQGDLSICKGLKLPEIEAEMKRRLDVCKVSDIDAAILKTVDTPQRLRLLGRCSGDPFPRSPSLFRKAFSTVRGGTLPDRRNWAGACIRAVERDIQPIVAKYRSVDRQRIVRVECIGGSTLILRKRTKANIPATIYQGLDTTSDFDLLWESRAEQVEEEAPQLRDTGIRLVCSPWSSRKTDGEAWHPAWPPHRSTTKCQLNTLRDFLISFGLPTKLNLKSGSRIEIQGTPKDTHAVLELIVSCEDFPEWSAPMSVQLNGQSEQELQKQVVEKAYELRGSILEHVRLRESLGSIPASSSIRSASNELETHLSHPDYGSITLVASLLSDFSFQWTPVIDRSLRDRLRSVLIATEETLSGNQNALSLSTLSFNGRTGNLIAKFDYVGVGKASEDQITLRWSPANGQATNVPESVPIMPAFSTSVDKSFREKIAQAADRHLENRYGRLHRKSVTHQIPIQNGKAFVNLVLRIEDWPQLILGPQVVEKSSEVPKAIDLLLSRESVKKASVAKWYDKGSFEHPRFGNVRGKLVDWDGSTPSAKIECHTPFGELGAMVWTDTLAFNGEWNGMDEEALSDELVRAFHLFKQKIVESLETYIPAGALTVDLDTFGIDGSRAISVNPPQIVLEAKARVPLGDPSGQLYIPVKIGGIRIDESGLRAPENYSFGLPGTLSLPWLAITEPMVTIGLERPSLGLGASLTPPTPGSGLIGNQWIGVLENEVELMGYWENFQLDGNSQLTVAGTPNVAVGNSSTDFSSTLTGSVRSDARLPGFDSVPARLGGRLNAGGDEGGMSVRGRADLLGENIAALSLASGEHNGAKGFNIGGRVQLPLGASASLTGGANSDLDDYKIQGTARLLNLRSTLIADEKEVKIENEITGDLDNIVYDTWSPTLASASPPLREKELAGKGTVATEEEKIFAESTFEHDRFGESTQSGASSNEIGEDQFEPVDIQLKVVDDSLRGVRKSDKKSLFLIPKGKFPSDIRSGDWTFKSWCNNRLAGQMLLINSPRRTAWKIEWSSTGRVLDSQPISQNWSATPSEALYLRFIDRYFALREHQRLEVDVDDSSIAANARSVCFDYVVKTDSAERDSSVCQARAYFVEHSNKIYSFDIHPHQIRVDTNRFWSPLCFAAFSMCTDARRLPRLVHIDKNGKRFGFVLLDGKRSSRIGAISIAVSQSGTPKAFGSLAFEVLNNDVSFQEKLQACTILCRAASHNLSLLSGKAFIGKTGAIVVDGNTWRVVADNGTNQPSVSEFQKADFVKCSDPDIESLMPADWGSEDLRSQLSGEDVARTALTSFASADRTVTPVRRMGLLQELASKTGVTTK